MQSLGLGVTLSYVACFDFFDISTRELLDFVHERSFDGFHRVGWGLYGPNSFGYEALCLFVLCRVEIISER